MNKTCTDCIHNDVCAKYNKVYERELSERYCAECDFFKDKSRFIELPCAVGDILRYNGVDYEVDHWNILAAAFSKDNHLHLFDIKEAKKAMKGGAE